MIRRAQVIPRARGDGQDGRTTAAAISLTQLRREDRDMASPGKRQQALTKLLDDLAEERGSLDAPEDESEIARYMRLLGGQPENQVDSRPTLSANRPVRREPRPLR